MPATLDACEKFVVPDRAAAEHLRLLYRFLAAQPAWDKRSTPDLPNWSPEMLLTPSAQRHAPQHDSGLAARLPGQAPPVRRRPQPEELGAVARGARESGSPRCGYLVNARRRGAVHCAGGRLPGSGPGSSRTHVAQARSCLRPRCACHGAGECTDGGARHTRAVARSGGFSSGGVGRGAPTSCRAGLFRRRRWDSTYQKTGAEAAVKNGRRSRCPRCPADPQRGRGEGTPKSKVSTGMPLKNSGLSTQRPLRRTVPIAPTSGRGKPPKTWSGPCSPHTDSPPCVSSRPRHATS